jgi:hypothetical protein
MDRKVRTIRLWLATAAVVALGCWEPAMWFGVPLFFFPDCSCCGPGAPACFACDPDYGGDFQATGAGFSNDTGTGCTVFNGTFEIPRLSGVAACSLQNEDISGVGTIVNCGSPNFGVIAILTGNVNENVSVRVQAGSGVEYTALYRDGTSPSDCASYSSESVPFVSTSGSTPSCCNEGTVELTAI